MMKIVALAMTLLVGSLAFGQEPATKKGPTAEDRAARMTERMKQELVLTADQAGKVADINLKIAQKNEGVKNNANFSPAQKKEIYESNEVARKAMLKEVLTPEQYKKYEENQVKRELPMEQRKDLKPAPAQQKEPVKPANE